MESPIVFVVKIQVAPQDLRRRTFRISAWDEFTFPQFCQSLPPGVCVLNLKWKDPDGDWISIRNQDDLTEALNNMTMDVISGELALRLFNDDGANWVVETAYQNPYCYKDFHGFIDEIKMPDSNAILMRVIKRETVDVDDNALPVCRSNSAISDSHTDADHFANRKKTADGFTQCRSRKIRRPSGFDADDESALEPAYNLRKRKTATAKDCSPAAKNQKLAERRIFFGPEDVLQSDLVSTSTVDDEQSSNSDMPSTPSYNEGHGFGNGQQGKRKSAGGNKGEASAESEHLFSEPESTTADDSASATNGHEDTTGPIFDAGRLPFENEALIQDAADEAAALLLLKQPCLNCAYCDSKANPNVPIAIANDTSVVTTAKSVSLSEFSSAHNSSLIPISTSNIHSSLPRIPLPCSIPCDALSPSASRSTSLPDHTTARESAALPVSSTDVLEESERLLFGEEMLVSIPKGFEDLCIDATWLDLRRRGKPTSDDESNHSFETVSEDFSLASLHGSAHESLQPDVTDQNQLFSAHATDSPLVQGHLETECEVINGCSLEKPLSPGEATGLQAAADSTDVVTTETDAWSENFAGKSHPMDEESSSDRFTALCEELEYNLPLAMLRQMYRSPSPTEVGSTIVEVGSPIAEVEFEEPPWQIHERSMLLQAMQEFQSGHTNNPHKVVWDYISSRVCAFSFTYRSPEQCRLRYEQISRVLRENNRMELLVPAAVSDQVNSAYKVVSERFGALSAAVLKRNLLKSKQAVPLPNDSTAGTVNANHEFLASIGLNYLNPLQLREKQCELTPTLPVVAKAANLPLAASETSNADLPILMRYQMELTSRRQKNNAA